jgi:3-oxoacyl-[acyl-carrier protein] reductase|uniref:3-oxoacyl-[acyl-carrier-protein] reductase n=1 Tax=candidate division WOR-3 bacterium TaxID=2052148 RepID=A0A7V3VU42_UNCW3
MALEGKVAIVTGGASGIGAAIAKRFIENGAFSIILDVVEELGKAFVSQFNQKAKFYCLNIADEKLVNETIDGIINEFSKIDILVNNAGITNDKLLLRMTKEDWEKVLNVNLTGTFLMTRAVVKHMMKQRYGRIINIASVIGLIGNAGQANYAASKAGIIGFTKSCAKEFASRNITVNAIAPGFIETRMTEILPEDVKQAYLKLIPLGRFGKPEDVANLALFLASDQAEYITGQVIAIDGGMVM